MSWPQSQRLAVQLRAALVNRSVIDQALGVIMSRTGATPEEAFDRRNVHEDHPHIKQMSAFWVGPSSALAGDRLRATTLSEGVRLHSARSVSAAVRLVRFPDQYWFVLESEWR
jgi:ANTAR domain